METVARIADEADRKPEFAGTTRCDARVRGPRLVMIPIQDLLHRIRWDPEFGRAAFVVGYFDRVKREIVRVPLGRVQIEDADRFSFTAVEPDGSVHDVPLHRIREVYRDGELIWQRAGPAVRA